MVSQDQATKERAVARPAAFRWLRITAPLTLLAVLVQAFFAGRGLFINGDQIDIHGQVANLTGLLVLIQVVLVFVAGLQGRFRSWMIGTNLLLLVLVFVQFGLGYGGRDSSEAASLHVPNGVLIFGVATVSACLAWFMSPRGDDMS